jgi:hypothetical protein
MSKKNLSGDPRKKSVNHSRGNENKTLIDKQTFGWEELSKIWNNNSWGTIIIPVSLLKDDVLDVICKTDPIIRYFGSHPDILFDFCFELSNKNGKVVYRVFYKR